MENQKEQIEKAVQILWSAINAGISGRDLQQLRLEVFAAERRAGAR